MAGTSEPSASAGGPSTEQTFPLSKSTSDGQRLEALIAQATAKYAIKDYLAAAEFYSQATELQAELNGEMAVENADLLYSYGRCLYHVAVKNSDVLGGDAAGAKLESQKQIQTQEKKKKKKTSIANGHAVDAEATPLPVSYGEEKLAEVAIASLVEEKSVDRPDDTKSSEQPAGDKPYFQFTGDENWDDPEDDDDEDGTGDGEAEEENDDFANAFEVLDLSRLLFKSRLEQQQDQPIPNTERGEASAPPIDSPEGRVIKERIADIHDLQAEIALEGERFSNAVVDLKAALALKEALLPKESSLLAECHYKLSLALEFSSVTQQRDEDGNMQGEASVDQEARDEAASEMSKAIESCKLRVAKEEQELGALEGEEMAPQRQKFRVSIEDVNEMIADMELRLVELKKPPVSLNDPRGTGTLDGSTPLNGILGQILGESQDEQKKRLEKASVDAKDLTGLVKRKKTRPLTATEETPTTPASATSGGTKVNGDVPTAGEAKRKVVDFADEIEEVGTGKKAKLEDDS